MVTKKEFCELIMDSHPNQPVVESMILMSSRLAVAMEYLGLITDPALKEYANSRGGVLFCGPTSNGIKALTVREVLSLLSD